VNGEGKSFQLQAPETGKVQRPIDNIIKAIGPTGNSKLLISI